MNFIDISIPINENLPVWPGDPQITLHWISQIKDGDESNVSEMEMSVHTGTHIDAPLHFIVAGKSVDQIPMSILIGEVVVVEVPKDVKLITESFLDNLTFKLPERVLFKTKNSLIWEGKNSKFVADFVAVSATGAQWLVEHGVRLVGIDYLSIAPFDDTVHTHEILLGSGIIVIENLDLSKVSPGNYRLICLPLNLDGREAAPARVVLEVL